MERYKMKNIAILVYSTEHQNTRKLVDAIAMGQDDIDVFDMTKEKPGDLSQYAVVGVASGIYAGRFAKPLLKYLKTHLREGQRVFALYTSSTNRKGYTAEIKSIAERAHCTYAGDYGCRGYTTFGPLKIFGGVAKDHPDAAEIQGAIDFFVNLKFKRMKTK
jgi:flavodoxin